MVAIIDRFLGKWASRKLVVFFIATLMACFGKLNSEDWAYIAIAYIFVQGYVDAKEYTKK